MIANSEMEKRADAADASVLFFFSLGCANFVAITVLIANTVLIIITKKWFVLVLSEDFHG